MFELPPLPYDYNGLEPFISEEQLKLHYDKHHAAYVNNANAVLQKLEEARKNNTKADILALTNKLTFNIAGHHLHSLFWENIAPASKKEPEDVTMQAISNEFGSFERFKKEFSDLAINTQGSGWAALGFDKEIKKPILLQIEKHQNQFSPTTRVLMVLDVWEHAYYLDYKNERPKFVEAFWNIANWDEVAKRYEIHSR